MYMDDMTGLRTELEPDGACDPTSKCDENYALSVHAHRLCILRVFMFVSLYLLLMWFVSCLSSVLLKFFLLYLYSFRSQFSVVGGILFTVTLGLEWKVSALRRMAKELSSWRVVGGLLKIADAKSAQHDLASRMRLSGERTPATSTPYFVYGWCVMGQVAKACKMLHLWQRLRERLTTSEGSECWWLQVRVAVLAAWHKTC